MTLSRLLRLALICISFAASAQELQPEGNNETAPAPLSGKLSLSIEGGASYGGAGWAGNKWGRPLYIGGTFSVWVKDWLLLDLNASYANANRIINVLTGVRFRTTFLPVAGSLGMRAGYMTDPSGGAAGLEVLAGLDWLIARHFIVGVEAAYDLPLPFPTDGFGPSARVSLNLGWRF